MQTLATENDTCSVGSQPPIDFSIYQNATKSLPTIMLGDQRVDNFHGQLCVLIALFFRFVECAQIATPSRMLACCDDVAVLLQDLLHALLFQSLG